MIKTNNNLPDGWRQAKVRDVFEIKNNLRKPISHEVRRNMKGDYPYYGPTGILDYIDEFQISEKLALIGEDGDHFLKYKEKPMTLLVSGKYNVNNHAHLISGTDGCLTEWFYWYFQHRNIFSHLSRQGAGRYKLNKKSLEQLDLILPVNILEQQKIASILSIWNTAIQKVHQLIEKKQRIEKGLMQELLTGKVRLKEFQNEGKWKVSRLEEYFTERKETGFVNLPLLSVGRLGVYPQDQSNKKDTSNKNKQKYKRICPGDIGYNTMRMWQGRSALSDLEGIVSPAYTIVTPKSNANSLFFAYLFKIPSVVHRFYRNSQGLTSDTLNCKFKDFKIVKVLIPPTLKEQEAIATVFEKVDKEIEILQRDVEFLEEQKKGLMQQLLTGKIRVNQ